MGMCGYGYGYGYGIVFVVKKKRKKKKKRLAITHGSDSGFDKGGRGCVPNAPPMGCSDTASPSCW